MATLLSVNVGLPKDVAWQGHAVHTGVWKHAVDGPRMVRRLNIDGDGQGGVAGHGGEQRAVLVYQTGSYRYWQSQLGRDDFEFGQFGENFTVDGLADDEVCVGDRYRIGGAEFEVTNRGSRASGSARTRSASPTSTPCSTCPDGPPSGCEPRLTFRRSARTGSSRSTNCSTPPRPALEPKARRSRRSRAGPGSGRCGSIVRCRRVRPSRPSIFRRWTSGRWHLPDQRQTRTARHGQRLPPFQLRPQAVLDVAAPRGDFVLSDAHSPVLLVSAGDGVTPVPVPTRFSCRTGVCHTCVTPVLTGRVTYSPSPLELPTEGSVLICCAQPEGAATVLDL